MHSNTNICLALLAASVVAVPLNMNMNARAKHPSSSALPSSTATNTKSPPPAAGGGGGGGDAQGLSALFPIPNALAQWTTLPGAPGALPLSDATLRPFKVMSGTTHDYVSAPDGKPAMEAKFPKGSYIPSKEPSGGFSFYAPGPEDVDFTQAEEVTFGYSVFFPTGFQFVKGGKLPGIYGGDDATTAVSCSGGRRDPTCFSARLMWRPEGAGELYTYLPDPSDPKYAANAKLCTMPNSECNPTYGASISRGAFTFPTGEWLSVSERVKLNAAGQADGELELFVGGKSVISATGLIIRDSDAGRMRGIQFQTFFGGATPEWASPVDQEAYFADFSVAIISKL
ncbi:polysaccharide lyase family 14 protein [Mycena latifolia]|nr:polysaccharide lyase family 14 protein [Mycena latifolia]